MKAASLKKKKGEIHRRKSWENLKIFKNITKEHDMSNQSRDESARALMKKKKKKIQCKMGKTTKLDHKKGTREKEGGSMFQGKRSPSQKALQKKGRKKERNGI